MNKQGRPAISNAGRTVTRCVTITPDDLAYLVKVDTNLSKAIRRLIEKDKATA